MEPTPLRPAEQVVGGFLHVTLGGQSYELTVLSMKANRGWTAQLAEQVRTVLGRVEPLETADQVADLIATQAEVMMDLLIAYDAAGAKVLPEREWIDTHATDRECYEALKRVTAAAYPFGPDLLHIVPQFLPALIGAVQRGATAATLMLHSSLSTSSSPPSTAGPPPTSTPPSPTNKSRSTRSGRRSGAGKPRSTT